MATFKTTKAPTKPLAAYSARKDGRADLIFAYTMVDDNTWVWGVRGCTDYNSGMVYWNSGMLYIDRESGKADLYGFLDINSDSVSGDIVKFECTDLQSEFDYQTFTRFSIKGEKLDDDAEAEDVSMKVSAPIIKALTDCLTRMDDFYEVHDDDKWEGYFIKKSVQKNHGLTYVESEFEIPFYALTVKVNRAGTFISLTDADKS